MVKPLRVAMLAPVAWRTPPLAYGPWEQVTSTLTEGLVARGIDVTLFATLDSVTTGRLDGICPHGYGDDPAMDGRVWEALHVSHALARSAEYDLVHNHLDWLPLAFAAHSRVPMVTTIHGFSAPAILPAYERAHSAYVSISDADRVPELTYAATVYHGVDAGPLPLNPDPGPDAGLVAFGRIHPDKGTHEAIAIARRLGRRLTICGPVQDQRYFDEQVAPSLDGDRVAYLGSVGPQGRAQVLGQASVLLHPIGFAEPFGLAVVESMLCGTPVVAYRRGSMAEIVDEGITGYLADDIESAAEHVAAAEALDRGAVRQGALQRFGVDAMVEGYLAVYEQVLSGGHGLVSQAQATHSRRC